VATNCRVVPIGIEGVAGVTTRETSVADVIVRVAELLIEPELDEIVETPRALLVTSP